MMAQQQQRPRPKSRAGSLGSMNGPPAARGASTPGTPRVVVTPTQLDKAQLDKAQLRRHSYTSPLMPTPHGKVRGAWHAVGALCWGGESERERDAQRDGCNDARAANDLASATHGSGSTSGMSGRQRM